LAFFGALLLVFTLFVRPQEFVRSLEALSLLNVTTAIAAIGIAFEFATGPRKTAWSPQLPWLLAFIAWCFVSTIKNLGVTDGIHEVNESAGYALVFMMITMYATSTFARYRAMAVLLVALGSAIAVVCIHQGHQEAQCVALETSKDSNENAVGTPDGRPCESAYLCEKGGVDKVTYACEKVGMFETLSTGMRVRWRGTLGDPNELAVMVGAMLPFLFVMNGAAKRRGFGVVTLALLGVAFYCVVLTGSRGGQLVIATVLGLYFVRRYGAKGLVFAAIVGLPVLLFGGRGGEDAESSALERTDLLYEGMDMIREHPILGVGVGQFLENTPLYQTAHNSYVLAAAELGLPGAVFWMMLVYSSMKIPFVIATRPPIGIDPRIVPFAYALVVSFAGILVGIFFLSFCYKQMLFIYFGLSGALYAAVKRMAPHFRITTSVKEVAYVTAAELLTLVLVFVYSRLKLAAG
jgi:O-antigen ligase